MNVPVCSVLLTCVDLRDSRALLARAFLSTSFSSSLLGGSNDLLTRNAAVLAQNDSHKLQEMKHAN